jgi:hypothetical protein
MPTRVGLDELSAIPEKIRKQLNSYNPLSDSSEAPRLKLHHRNENAKAAIADFRTLVAT